MYIAFSQSKYMSLAKSRGTLLYVDLATMFPWIHRQLRCNAYMCSLCRSNIHRYY